MVYQSPAQTYFSRKKDIIGGDSKWDTLQRCNLKPDHGLLITQLFPIFLHAHLT